MSKKTFTKSGFIAAREANKVFTLCDNSKEQFNRLWVWPANGMTGGKCTANTGDIYIGERTESGDFTPDKIASGDTPILIELPQGETKELREVIFQADNAGDGVFFKYW